MSGPELLRRARTRPLRYPRRTPRRPFRHGARWMHRELAQCAPTLPFPPAVDYTAYGYLKYGLALLATLPFFLGAVVFSGWILPLVVPAFYLVEIQFLFLFPLLVDRQSPALPRSLYATATVGYGRALATVLFLAAFMLLGLLRPRDPLRNWYLGCRCIIIWYVEEVRDRL